MLARDEILRIREWAEALNYPCTVEQWRVAHLQEDSAKSPPSNASGLEAIMDGHEEHEELE